MPKSKIYKLKLSKCEVERLLDDCLDLADGDELYFGSSVPADFEARRMYLNILNKLRLLYYGKDIFKRPAKYP